MSVSGPPRAVVFDFNGTISDDEPLLAELFVVIFGEIGIEVTEERYFGEFAGYSDPEIVERVLMAAGRHTDATARALLDRRAELYLARAGAGETVRPPVAYTNVLKLRPPLVFRREHVELLLATLDDVLRTFELRGGDDVRALGAEW